MNRSSANVEKQGEQPQHEQDEARSPEHRGVMFRVRALVSKLSKREPGASFKDLPEGWPSG